MPIPRPAVMESRSFMFRCSARPASPVDGGHPRDAMPELPAWAEKTTAGDESVWAPAVTARDDGYLLYFTARSTSQHTQCIGVARAWAPEGPFHSIGSQPLVCQSEDVYA